MKAQVRVVLVETSDPGNIGAAARAMKTMCLDDLVLVKPGEYPSAKATARASGADDLLDRARVCQSLEEAIADCSMVIGTSARPRKLGWPELAPRQLLETVSSAGAGAKVAVVFGRERTGLFNEELDLCSHTVNIPANPDYASLNLAAAVQIVAYELHVGQAPVPEYQPDSPPATAGELEDFYRHLESALTASEFLDPENPKHLMRRLRRFFSRARPEHNEINIFRGMLTAMGYPASPPRSGKGV